MRVTARVIRNRLFDIQEQKEFRFGHEYKMSVERFVYLHGLKHVELVEIKRKV